MELTASFPGDLKPIQNSINQFVIRMSEELEISVIVALSSSTALACSVAPCAKDWELLDTWSEPADTWSADWEILEMVSLIRMTNWLMLF